MQLVIDIGNTRVKTAVYEEKRQVFYHVCASDDDFRHTIGNVSDAYPITSAALSNVGELNATRTDALASISVPLLHVSGLTPTPLTIDYATPETLGADRVAAAVGAFALYPGHDLLVIDSGTCITYDYVSADAHFLGGNISPGITMRLAAMHEHTARLPQPEDGRATRIGRTTEEALRNGARLGLMHELQGYIHSWLEDTTLKNPLVLLADGQNMRCELPAATQERIITCHDLVLHGLNAILKYPNDNINS